MQQLKYPLYRSHEKAKRRKNVGIILIHIDAADRKTKSNKFQVIS